MQRFYFEDEVETVAEVTVTACDHIQEIGGQLYCKHCSDDNGREGESLLDPLTLVTREEKWNKACGQLVSEGQENG